MNLKVKGKYEGGSGVGDNGRARAHAEFREERRTVGKYLKEKQRKHLKFGERNK